jgi:hypothetical protein
MPTELFNGSRNHNRSQGRTSAKCAYFNSREFSRRFECEGTKRAASLERSHFNLFDRGRNTNRRK